MIVTDVCFNFINKLYTWIGRKYIGKICQNFDEYLKKSICKFSTSQKLLF